MNLLYRVAHYNVVENFRYMNHYPCRTKDTDFVRNSEANASEFLESMNIWLYGHCQNSYQSVNSQNMSLRFSGYFDSCRHVLIDQILYSFVHIWDYVSVYRDDFTTLIGATLPWRVTHYCVMEYFIYFPSTVEIYFFQIYSCTFAAFASELPEKVLNKYYLGTDSRE